MRWAGPYPEAVHLAAGGRVVLGDRRPGDPPLPDELRASIREWGALASALAASQNPRDRELVRARGRFLASRTAEVLGRPVDFVDPASGARESVRAGATDPIPRLAPDPRDPTPWPTGLAVAGFFAVLVTVADVVLIQAFAEAFGLLWVPANLLVGLGLAPTLFLVRRTPFWRWPALGTAAGLAVTWVVMLVGLLG
jgi:hypothetical protein